VVVVGSLNVDLLVRVDRRAEAGETIAARGASTLPGGKGANTAVAAARAGAPTTLVGAVGADPAGDGLLAALRDESVDVSAVAALAGAATGSALITVTPDGESSIVIIAGANALVDPRTAAAEAGGLGPGDVLASQLEVPLAVVEEAVRAATDAGARALLTLSPARQVPLGLLLRLDPLVVNEHEAAVLLGAPVDDAEGAAVALHAKGPRSVVVTAGARGAAVCDASGSTTVTAAHVGAPVDATGAGDCLTGVLAARLAAGADLVDALRDAVRAATISVTRAGAWPSYPLGEELL